MADYWTPPTHKIGRDLRVTFDSLRKALNTNLDSVLSSITSLLSFQSNAEGVWTTYTPSNVNITLGNGVCTGAYKQIGKTVHFRWYLAMGTTTAFNAFNPQIGLPVQSVGVVLQVAPLYMIDTGVKHWLGLVRIEAGSTVGTMLHTETGGSGALTSTNPWTMGTGDLFAVSGTYEAA